MAKGIKDWPNLYIFVLGHQNHVFVGYGTQYKLVNKIENLA